MGYSNDESMVRVDFFKPSGKWYTTEEMKWIGYDTENIHEAFALSLRKAFGMHYTDMDVICLEPYHEHAFPLCFRNGGWIVYKGWGRNDG